MTFHIRIIVAERACVGQYGSINTLKHILSRRHTDKLKIIIKHFTGGRSLGINNVLNKTNISHVRMVINIDDRDIRFDQVIPNQS